MTYSIKLTNGTKIVDIPDGVVDTGTTSLSLVGKNVSGYGAPQNANFVGLLENFANATAPDSPLDGQLWYDSGTKTLKIFSNSMWKSIGKLEVAATKPSTVTANIGNIWYDSADKQLNIFNGVDFDLIGTSIPGYGKSRLEGSTILGIKDGESVETENPVLTLYIDDTPLAIISKYMFEPTVAISDLYGNNTITGWVLKGINFLNASELNGITDQARKLNDPTDGPLNSSSFVRTDSTAVQEVDSPIWTKTSTRVGVLNNTTDYLVSLSNYQGSNANPLLDAQIKFTGNRIVFTNDKPLAPAQDVIMIDSTSTSNLITPATSATSVDLGDPARKFNNVYANTFNGPLVGSVYGNVTGNINGSNARLDTLYTRDGSVTAIDLTSNDVQFYGAFNGAVNGTLVGTVTGNVTGDVTGDLTGNVTGDVTGNVDGDVTGDVTGNVFGNVKGNILDTNNQVIVNNTTRQFSGSLIGNADSASALAVARTINNVEFDGTQSITITDNTRIARSGDTMAGPLSLAAAPTLPLHAVTKQYVDQALASKPLFFSLDTRGLTISGSGPGSVIDLLNTIAPVGTLLPLTTCRISSTTQNISTTTDFRSSSWISISYIYYAAVTTTVTNPTYNNNLVYRVNSSGTSWEYVSG